jgi:bifunctional non-homologous end joining protein LigD
MFEHACKLGLEGIVSQHGDRAYRAGRSPHWIKAMNR